MNPKNVPIHFLIGMNEWKPMATWNGTSMVCKIINCDVKYMLSRLQPMIIFIIAWLPNWLITQPDQDDAFKSSVQPVDQNPKIFNLYTRYP